MRLLIVLMVLALLVGCQSAPSASTPPAKAAVKGTLIDIQVGDDKDGGWGTAHFEATTAVAKERGWNHLWFQNLNPGNPNKPVCENVTDELLTQARAANPGGKVVVRYNSDDFKDCAERVARKHPDVYVVHISGDHAAHPGAPKNLMNAMAANEYTASLAGCAAGVMTKSGKIAWLTGPWQAETVRVFNAYTWGAQRCAAAKRIESFNLSVGFWFHIPGGTTNDPQQLLRQAFALGADMFGVGIDTQDALQYAKQLKTSGQYGLAFGWDWSQSCKVAAEVCIGAPYLNWRTELHYVMDGVERGTFKSEFKVLNPDWDKVFTADSPTGFVFGEAVSPEARAAVEKMAAQFKSGELKLLQGPIKQADGKVFVEAGKAPAYYPDIWNWFSLIEGGRAYGRAQ